MSDDSSSTVEPSMNLYNQILRKDPRVKVRSGQERKHYEQRNYEQAGTGTGTGRGTGTGHGTGRGTGRGTGQCDVSTSQGQRRFNPRRDYDSRCPH